jgi:hypothetical protein
MSSILEELTVMREKFLYLKGITGFKKEGTKKVIVFSEDEEDLNKYNEYNTQFEALEKEDNEELYKVTDNFFERFSSKAVIQNFENMSCELEDITEESLISEEINTIAKRYI